VASAPGAQAMIYRLLGSPAPVGPVAGGGVRFRPQTLIRSPATARRRRLARATGGPLHGPGYAARKARLIQTGPDGQPLYTLDAAQIQQQPNQGTVDLQQVLLGFRDTSGNAWTARADRGQLSQGSGVVQLEGDVQVVGALPD